MTFYQSPQPPPLARSVIEPTTRRKAVKKATTAEKKATIAEKKSMFPNLPVSAGPPPPSMESPLMDSLSNKRKLPIHEVSETESHSSSHESIPLNLQKPTLPPNVQKARQSLIKRSH